MRVVGLSLVSGSRSAQAPGQTRGFAGGQSGRFADPAADANYVGSLGKRSLAD